MKPVLKAAIGLTSVLCIIGADEGTAQTGGGRGMMERFQMLDSDTDGQVSASEAAEWHETVFLTMDANEDGQLTRDEYMAIQLGRGADPDQRGPRYAERQIEKDARFTMMDADGDGLVTQAQFFADGQLRFTTADADKSGSVTLPEFIAMRWM